MTSSTDAGSTPIARRQARYEEAARLRAKGVPLRRIAVRLGAERKTVRRWLRLGHAPLWKKPARGSLLAPYREVLDRRWAEGCRNAAQLWRELVGLGFAGRPGVVRAWAGQRRQQEPAAAMRRTEPVTPAWQPPSSRRIAFLLTAEIERLSERERAFITLLRSEAPRLVEAAAVAVRLRQVLRREGSETL